MELLWSENNDFCNFSQLEILSFGPVLLVQAYDGGPGAEPLDKGAAPGLRNPCLYERDALLWRALTHNGFCASTMRKCCFAPNFSAETCFFSENFPNEFWDGCFVVCAREFFDFSTFVKGFDWWSFVCCISSFLWFDNQFHKKTFYSGNTF